MKTDISIVIPVLNEEQTVTPLYTSLKEILSKLKKNYEIIFIDDGSTDNTTEILETIQAKDKSVKLYIFQKNFGKAAALSCGFENANGRYVFTMDADLQDDPSEIPNFLEKIENENFDLVSGWKFERKDPPSKLIPSRFFNFVTSKVSKINIHDFNCGFKCYKNEVVKNIKIYGELHRFIPVIAEWKGYKVGELKVKHNPREYGKSKYGLSRFYNGFFDLITVYFITRYLKRPFHLFAPIGLIFSIAGIILGIFLSYQWLQGEQIGTRPLLLLSVMLIILGFLVMLIGLLGELITNTSNDKEFVIKNK